MRVCPCKDCTERQCGCHSHCEKYKDWRKEYDERKKEIEKNKISAKENDYYLYDAKWRIYKRYYSKSGRRK